MGIGERASAVPRADLFIFFVESRIALNAEKMSLLVIEDTT